MSAITQRNKDIEHIVNAAARVGWYGLGKRQPKRLAMLVTTDVHRCPQQLHSAVDYLNDMEALDCGICLGDIQGSNFTENDGSWYSLAVNAAQKPFYTVIGNHDGGHNTKKEATGSKTQVWDKFIRPTRGRMGMPSLDKTYYAVNFDDYRITLIVMDNYMAPEDRDDNGDYRVMRGITCLDQAQVDWLVETLAAVPTGYHVVLARHAFPDAVTEIDSHWTQPGAHNELDKSVYGEGDLVPDLINAWITGGCLQKAYAPTQKYAWLPTLSVRADFTARGEGVFVTYLIGHMHRDMLAASTTYPDQNVVFFPATGNDDWQNYDSDLMRERGTKAEDCLTVFAVDTDKRQFHLVRVGSNITEDLTDRTHITVSY